MTALLVIVGGALGAPARFLLDGWIQSLHTKDWPWGTLVVNWIGSFALGLIAATEMSMSALLGVGFIGAFTTWSTFMVETVRLNDEDGWSSALGYLLLSLVGGVALAFFGHSLTA